MMPSLFCIHYISKSGRPSSVHRTGTVQFSIFQFSSVQSLTCVQLFVISWTTTHQVSLSKPTPRVYTNSCPWSRWCHPTISSCHPLLLLPSIFSSIRVFSNEEKGLFLIFQNKINVTHLIVGKRISEQFKK